MSVSVLIALGLGGLLLVMGLALGGREYLRSR